MCAAFLSARTRLEIRCEVQRDPFGHRIPVLGDLNGRREHLIHFLPAEAIEKLLPAVDGARNRGRFDAALRHIAKSLVLQPLERLPGREPSRWR